MEWQPIETAPKDGTEVLIAGGTYSDGWNTEIPFRGVSIAYWYRCHDAHWRGDDLQAHDEWREHKPTHWMPLPPPPQDNGGQQG